MRAVTVSVKGKKALSPTAGSPCYTAYGVLASVVSLSTTASLDLCMCVPISLSLEGFCLQLPFSVFDLPLQAVGLVGKVQLEASGSLLGRGAVPLCLL